MAKTKVRVLYASAFIAAGVDVYDRDKKGTERQRDEVEVEGELADALVAQGYAEKVGKKA